MPDFLPFDWGCSMVQGYFLDEKYVQMIWFWVVTLYQWADMQSYKKIVTTYLVNELSWKGNDLWNEDPPGVPSTGAIPSRKEMVLRSPQQDAQNQAHWLLFGHMCGPTLLFPVSERGHRRWNPLRTWDPRTVICDQRKRMRTGIG